MVKRLGKINDCDNNNKCNDNLNRQFNLNYQKGKRFNKSMTIIWIFFILKFSHRN